MDETKRDETQEKQPVRFTKAALLGFERYRRRRDLLAVLLKDGEHYTTAEVDKRIANFMKKKVK